MISIGDPTINFIFKKNLKLKVKIYNINLFLNFHLINDYYHTDSIIICYNDNLKEIRKTNFFLTRTLK